MFPWSAAEIGRYPWYTLPDLAGNLIGDPSQRDLVVYLPPSYHSSTRRYPTAYLLHGYGGRAIDWTIAHQQFGGWLLQPIDEVLGISAHLSTQVSIA